MICKLCGHIFTDNWWEYEHEDLVDRRTGTNLDQDAVLADYEWEHIEEVCYCHIYPEAAKTFCWACMHNKIRKLRYHNAPPPKNDEEVACGIALALIDAAKKIKKYGFFVRCESTGVNSYTTDGRCRWDASKILPNGKKVCGHCYNAFMQGRHVNFVGEESMSHDPPSLKYAKLLLAET